MQLSLRPFRLGKLARHSVSALKGEVEVVQCKMLAGTHDDAQCLMRHMSGDFQGCACTCKFGTNDTHIPADTIPCALQM